MNIKKLSIALAATAILTIIGISSLRKETNLPVVAIANWGPHSSLDASIQGLKDELSKEGFVGDKTIRYEITDVGFDPSLISQMVSKLKSHHPKVMVVVATPVAQYAKSAVKDIPLIYNVITDPVEAGLVKESHKPDGNMTGSSDKQDLALVLEFAKKLIPNAKRVGLLYATAESNDAALVKMMEQAAKAQGMEVLALPVNQARDVPVVMQGFKGKVDLLYVGPSGPIQPTLPVIAAESAKMGIPIFNVNEEAVKQGLVLGSFGVDYHQVGTNTGKLVGAVLKGADIATLAPIYPSHEDYHGFISKKQAKSLGIEIPAGLSNVEIVE